VDGAEVAVRLAQVRERIRQAAARAGREASGVTLVAVTKRQPMDRVLAAVDAGHRVFGENYPQELRAKAEALADHQGLVWHAIGTLQKNKAKIVARYADVFHALDDLETAEAVGRRREGAPLQCFVEVNVAGEATKSGTTPAGAAALVGAARAVAGIEVVGLMTMPPQESSGWVPEHNRPYFRRLGALAAELGLPRLSMGTTEDLEVAVEEGATEIRVGRAIFGER
jgi:pyridoxal phosphate enzyme (YggS family)